MARVKDLTELTVKDLWKGVKSEEEWWGDLKQETVRLVKRFIEATMDEEIMEQLQRGKYQRTEVRCGYRNGYQHRSLLTEYGMIERIKVPRDRESRYQPTMIARYQRRQQEVNRLLRETFLAGVSTRRVGEILAPILGESLSPQAISRVVSSLDAEVRRYHSRQFKNEWRYLLLDGITLKMKTAGGVKKRLVLCAYGISICGKRELINFRQATAESEAQWEAFLQDLYRRGLTGESLLLVGTDGCTGLHRALDTVYPYVPRQRCWAHKLRNMAAKMRRSNQAACLREAKRIYQANTKQEAIARFHALSDRWCTEEPKALNCLAQDLDELLNFLDCPVEHRRKMRTTNAIERAFREVRRRTRPMSCFQNSASIDRIIYGVISHLNNSWEEKPLFEFTHLS